jgi:tetratricopeptide (TPR) repeat protein
MKQPEAMTKSFSESDLLIQRGIKDLQQGRIDTAIGLFTAALHHSPHSICAFSNRASAYYAQGCYQNALNDLSRALELAPDLSALYINRGITHNKLGDIERATADFEQAIRLNPQHLGAYFNQTIVLSPQPPYQNLEQPMNSENPASNSTHHSTQPSAQATYNLAGIARKEFHQTIFKLSRAVSEFCSEIDVQLNEIMVRKTQTDMLKFALLVYNQAIAKEPHNPLLYWDRSCLLSDIQQFDQAIVDLDQAIRLNPNHPIFWANRGILHYKLMDLAQAFVDLTKSLALDPASADVYANRAVVLIGLERYEEARCDLDRAIQLAPENSVLLSLRASLSS